MLERRRLVAGAHRLLERGCGEADVGNRTRDLILTMDALYQLSYVGGRCLHHRTATGPAVAGHRYGMYRLVPKYRAMPCCEHSPRSRFTRQPRKGPLRRADGVRRRPRRSPPRAARRRTARTERRPPPATSRHASGRGAAGTQADARSRGCASVRMAPPARHASARSALSSPPRSTSTGGVSIFRSSRRQRSVTRVRRAGRLDIGRERYLAVPMLTSEPRREGDPDLSECIGRYQEKLIVT